MRRALALLCLLSLALPGFSDAWDRLLSSRMEDSASYKQARLKYEEARLGRDKFSKPFLPSLSIGTSGQTGLGIQDGAFSGGTIAPKLSFAEILGAELSVQTPLVLGKTGAFSFGNPSLSLTRKLFVETEADWASAEATLLRTEGALREAENTLRLQLATEVLSAFYSLKLLEENARSLGIQERLLAATPEAASESVRRAILKKVLQAQKAILTAKATLASLDSPVREGAMDLFPLLVEKSAGWIVGIPGEEALPPESLALRAQKLSLVAAERRAAFSLFPYLPNPSFSGQLAYDLEKGKLSWGLSLQFSFVALDKGERAYSALQRQENAEIERINLLAAKKAVTDGIRVARDKLASLELDRRIKALDLADAEEEFARAQILSQGGFATEEALETSGIDLALKQLDALNIDNDILIQKIKLAQFYTAGQL